MAASVSFAAPPTAAPAPAHSSAGAGAASGTGFAQMLSLASDRNAPQSADAKAAAQSEAGANKNERADKPPGDEAESRPVTDEHEDAAAEAESDSAEEGASLDPTLVDWMAALNWPRQGPNAAGKLGDRAATGELGEGELDAQRPNWSRTGAAGKGAAELPGATAQAARRDSPTARQAAEFQAELAQATGQEHTESPGAFRIEAATPLSAALPMGSLRAGAAAAAVTTVAVPQPVQSPEFPQALGVQLSLLAKQGVQQAELHLNPAEMGPIAVQIALDGSKAQVDFAAASAETRQILENGLPELAAALRDAGLTLSGGGVFQQPRQAPRGEDTPANGSGRVAGSGADGAGDEAATPVRRTVHVSPGGVDLYA